MSQVKSKQAEKSRQTQRRILAAAHELFVDRGYGQAALQDVADRAGVSVQSIYFLFRTKRNLLKTVVDVTVAGDDEPVATMERPWFEAAMNAQTADDQLQAHVDGATAVLERAAAITDVLRAAAGVEPELDELWQLGLAGRHTVQRTAAEALRGKPGARTDITADRAADLLFALLSPELYLLLVRDRAWTCDQYRHWAYGTLAAQLLDG
ncbi:MAG TPA: helix-turn-helix domain-containing protein [Nonomuraea sp.]|nr:helix-turn-helix domain-containing protein [Nonomuraea sp.]